MTDQREMDPKETRNKGLVILEKTANLSDCVRRLSKEWIQKRWNKEGNMMLEGTRKKQKEAILEKSKIDSTSSQRDSSAKSQTE